MQYTHYPVDGSRQMTDHTQKLCFWENLSFDMLSHRLREQSIAKGSNIDGECIKSSKVKQNT